MARLTVRFVFYRTFRFFNRTFRFFHVGFVCIAQSHGSFVSFVLLDSLVARLTRFALFVRFVRFVRFTYAWVRGVFVARSQKPGTSFTWRIRAADLTKRDRSPSNYAGLLRWRFNHGFRVDVFFADGFLVMIFLSVDRGFLADRSGFIADRSQLSHDSIVVSDSSFTDRSQFLRTLIASYRSYACTMASLFNIPNGCTRLTSTFRCIMCRRCVV